MTLDKACVHRCYKVNKLDMDTNIERHLEALGLIAGTNVTVLNSKKGGAVIFKVRGTRLAVGKKIAEGIYVEEND